MMERVVLFFLLHDLTPLTLPTQNAVTADCNCGDVPVTRPAVSTDGVLCQIAPLRIWSGRLSPNMLPA